MYRRFGISRLETETSYRTANLRRQVTTDILPRGIFLLLYCNECLVPFGPEKPHTVSHIMVLTDDRTGDIWSCLIK